MPSPARASRSIAWATCATASCWPKTTRPRDSSMVRRRSLVGGRRLPGGDIGHAGRHLLHFLDVDREHGARLRLGHGLARAARGACRSLRGRREPGRGRAGDAPAVDVAEVEKVVARMARIPEKQASASDRERLKNLEEVPAARGVRPAGGGAPGHPGHQAFAGRAGDARPAGRLLPVHGTHRRRQDGVGQAARHAISATSSIATT